MGVLTQHASEVHDLRVSRRQPSLQLVGRPDHATLDLTSLRRRGVRLTGRITNIRGARVECADDLISTTAAADVKLATVLMRIDEFIRRNAIDADRAEPFVPTWSLRDAALTELDLRTEGIGTIIWATGYRRSYRWLHVPVLDSAGDIRHQLGVTPCPGLYVLGMNFQHRRNSSFIDGVGHDAEHVAQLIAARVRRLPSAGAPTQTVRIG
jgi:putative flavoprotein involved in K+ transport